MSHGYIFEKAHIDCANHLQSYNIEQSWQCKTSKVNQISLMCSFQPRETYRNVDGTKRKPHKLASDTFGVELIQVLKSSLLNTPHCKSPTELQLTTKRLAK